MSLYTRAKFVCYPVSDTQGCGLASARVIRFFERSLSAHGGREHHTGDDQAAQESSRPTY
jgi:hypothetical protein